MDKSKFNSDKSGQLIEIHGAWGRDWAFIPLGLPPNWNFDASLYPLLVQAMEALGRLDGIGQTLPNASLLLRPLQKREALRSSSLEGTYATPEEMLAYEKTPREPTSKNDKANTWREVFNYSGALENAQKSLHDGNDLSLLTIKSMHWSLLHNVRGGDKAPGEFRTKQNHIGSNRRYVPPPPASVIPLMSNLDGYMSIDPKEYHPLVRSFIVHYQFEAIHPFLDGNGRVGRLLLAMMVYKLLNHRHPWLYMSAYFEKYKDEYIENLFNVSARGDWNTWIEFCLRGTIAQAKDSIRRCEALNRLHSIYRNKVSLTGGSPRAVAIVDRLFETPVIEVSDVKKLCDVSYNTARSDIAKLEKCGILNEHPKQHPKLYFANEIFDIAYSEEVDY